MERVERTKKQPNPIYHSFIYSIIYYCIELALRMVNTLKQRKTSGGVIITERFLLVLSLIPFFLFPLLPCFSFYCFLLFPSFSFSLLWAIVRVQSDCLYFTFKHSVWERIPFGEILFWIVTELSIMFPIFGLYLRIQISTVFAFLSKIQIWRQFFDEMNVVPLLFWYYWSSCKHL